MSERRSVIHDSSVEEYVESLENKNTSETQMNFFEGAATRDRSLFMWGGGVGGEIMGGSQAQFFQRQGVGQKKVSL